MVTSRRAPDIITQIESAARAVRVLLAITACFVLVAHRPFTRSPSYVMLAGVLAAIAVGVTALNVLSVQTQRRWSSSSPLIGFGQLLDVAAAVGLVVALDAPLEGQSYVLLVIPVVTGSVRHGTASAMLSWAGGCAAYAAMSLVGVIAVGDSVTSLVRSAGILLVIAATVGILARWMREGWEIQNELTDAAAEREGRLQTIEAAARAMARLSADEAISLCLHHSLHLRFDAVTSRPEDSSEFAQLVGETTVVAQLEGREVVTDGEISLTKWTKHDAAYAYSASVIEPLTKTVITGWSTLETDSEQAKALSMMVAQTTNAIETSTLLSQLRSEASSDALTGLSNRRSFEEALNEIARTRSPVAIGFVDVDYFKQVNDHYGHAAGDFVLSTIARRLEASLRPGDVAARIGGDEFVVLLRDATAEDTRRVGDAIALAMRSPIVVDGKPLFITLSIGFVNQTAPLDPDALMEQADQAVYRAKEGGRNRIVYSMSDSPAADSSDWPMRSSTAGRILSISQPQS